jgi:hypothetical protein
MDQADIAAAHARERREANRAAEAFAQACQGNDPERLLEAVDALNLTVGGWTIAMSKVGKLEQIQHVIQRAFISVWIESKALPLEVGSRTVLARALRKLLPPIGQDVSSELILYRGTNENEHRRRRWGFSWTTDVETARKFAPRFGGNVVLKTVASRNAVLLVRMDEEYYDEREVVVDPFALGQVRLLERLTSD